MQEQQEYEIVQRTLKMGGRERERERAREHKLSGGVVGKALQLVFASEKTADARGYEIVHLHTTSQMNVRLFVA